MDAKSKLYADKNAIKFIDGLIEKRWPNYTGAMKKKKAYNLMAKYSWYTRYSKIKFISRDALMN